MDLERSIPGKVIAERCVINTVREMEPEILDRRIQCN